MAHPCCCQCRHGKGESARNCACRVGLCMGGVVPLADTLPTVIAWWGSTSNAAASQPQSSHPRACPFTPALQASWLAARLAFTRATAAWGMVGHMLGLGDRHGENIMIDMRTGECIDFM